MNAAGNPLAVADINDRRRLGRMLAVLLVAPFLAQADVTIVNVATPAIHIGLGASGAALELVVGGYLVAFAVLLVTGARLGQARGYRRMFLLGLALFGLASLTCGLAQSPLMLVIARAVQGAAAAAMFPQALSGIQLHFQDGARARAIGLFTATLSTGAVAGQIAGGALVSADIAGIGWRSVFLVNVPVTAIALAAGQRVLPADEQYHPQRLDLAGVMTLAAALLLLMVPLALGRSTGWPPWTWACLAASAPALWLFITIERHRTGGSADRRIGPLLNIRLVQRPDLASALITLLATSGTYFALLFTLAQYLQHGLHYTALSSGLTLVPWVAAFGVAGLLMRRLHATPARLAPAAGGLLLALAYTGISLLLLTAGHLEIPLILIMGVGGFGLGIAYNSLIAHLTSRAPPGYAADISGVSTTIGQIGGALGVAGFGTLYFGLATGGSVRTTSIHAFAVTTAAFAAVAALSTVTAWLTTHSRPDGDRSAPVPEGQ